MSNILTEKKFVETFFFHWTVVHCLWSRKCLSVASCYSTLTGNIIFHILEIKMWRVYFEKPVSVVSYFGVQTREW